MVEAALVYSLRGMPDGTAGGSFEGPSLICRFCGGTAYREGDPRLRGRTGHGTYFVRTRPPAHVPACLKHVCDAVVATPESRAAVMNLDTGEILYFSRRSRRQASIDSSSPGPYGRELDQWLQAQPHAFERLPEFDGEERRSVMKQFVSTLADDRIRERLTRLTEGYRPYSGFRRGLGQYPWHESRWLEYSRRHVLPMVTDWLQHSGIDLAGTHCR